MARRSHYRETRYADPPASERISVVLEMEVSTRRSPAGALEVRKLIGEMAENNPTWGGTDRPRALDKDRHSDLPANGSALYADGTEAARNDFPTLDDVRAESCQSDHRV